MSRSVRNSWTEIEPYLDELLDLDPDRRETWFANLQARAPHLAASLRAHMAALEELKAQNYLDVAIPARIPRTSLAGKQFGAYTLERAIGHGGMGTVWLAHRNDGQFEGKAAVKLLNMALVGHPSERRLARERRLLAKLQHPNIAHLHDAGVGEHGQPYLVLEYVRGEPIDRYCEARKLSCRERISLFLDVLSAVSYAHSHLIVHRDLKPSNILVTEQGVVKLLDFGMAALLSPTAQDLTELTQQLAPGLTPGYAAPEQLLGDPITTATDVHALGALLFVLLSGRHPSLSAGKSRAQWMRALLDSEAPRLSEVAAADRDRRMLRGDLDNIVAMALRRRAADRYGTVDHFAQDLRHYLALEPVSARPRSLAYLTTMFARRHRVAIAAALAGAVIVAAAMVITTQQMFEARYQRDQVRYQSNRADTSIDFMGQVMRANADVDGTAHGFHRRLELGVEMLKKQYQIDPKFAGEMLVVLADYYRNDGETVRANQLYAQAYELGRRNHDTELIVAAQCSRASGDAYAGLHDGTEQRINEAQSLLAQIGNPDVSLTIGCLLAKAQFKASRDDYAEAEGLVRQAMILREEVDGTTETVAYAGLLAKLGAIYYAHGQPHEALQATQSASEVYDRFGRGRMVSGISARNSMSAILTNMGEIRRALDEREVVKQRLSEAGGPAMEHVGYPIGHASLLLRMGKSAAAYQALDGVVERARQAGNPLFHAWALLGAASASIQQGRWDDAEDALKEVASLHASGGGDRGTRAFAGAYAAEMALARGDLESARRHRTKFLEFAGYGTLDPRRVPARPLLVAAKIALAEGAAADAERIASDALRLFESKARGPDTSADVGEALLRIAEARLLANPGADVRSMLERADRCLTNGLDASHPLTLEVRKLVARSAP
jgi:tetratricopeptide (TPR) repeat protein